MKSDREALFVGLCVVAGLLVVDFVLGSAHDPIMVSGCQADFYSQAFSFRHTHFTVCFSAVVAFTIVWFAMGRGHRRKRRWLAPLAMVICVAAIVIVSRIHDSRQVDQYETTHAVPSSAACGDALNF